MAERMKRLIGIIFALMIMTGAAGGETMASYNLAYTGAQVDAAIANMAALDNTLLVVGRVSKNLFDKTAVEDGYYISAASGSKLAAANWSASGLIAVTAGEHLVATYTDHQGAFFTAALAYISGFDNTNNPIAIPATTAYMKVSVANARLDGYQMEYGLESTRYETFGAKLSTGTVIHVIPDGSGDFTNIPAAVDSITDSSQNNIYDIYIHEGTYDIFAGLQPSQYAIGVLLPDYVNLIGVGEKSAIILNGVHAVGSDDDGVTGRSTLNISYNNKLKNMTVAVTNGRYAVHADNSNTYKDYEQTIENCDFIHYGNDPSFTWQNIIAWGAGLASGAREKFVNCNFTGAAGYSCHNNASFDADTYQEFDNCVFEGEKAGSCVQLISMDSGVQSRVAFKGCTFNGKISLTNNGVNDFEFDISGYGNTKTEHDLADNAFLNFKDEIFSTVANTTITKGTPIKAYYNQCEPLANTINGKGLDGYYSGVCVLDCLDGETCYAKYAGFMDLTGIVAGITVGNYIGITSGVLAIVATPSDAIGRIVDGGHMRFY